jgi:CRISPR/Cas system CSM-associated protein Csm5 (group 7 of RAMP superfamily)
LSNNEFREKKEKTRVAEAIPTNVLLKNPLEIRLVYREMDKTLFPAVSRIVDFPGTLREHYKRWIPREIEILKKYPSKSIASVIQFYESLMKKLEAGALLLHVGFGTGWQSKTGAFLEKNRFMWKNNIQDYVNDCKWESQKRKHPFTRVQEDRRYKDYPFPKSRKFVMSGKDLLPPGWVEIREEEVKP